MRILHFIESTAVEFGGVPRFCIDIAKQTAGLGHATAIMTPDARDVPAVWVTGNSNTREPSVVVLEGTRGAVGRLSAGMISRARGAIAAHDVVHVHGVFSTALVQVAALARRTGVPYVVTIHGMLDDWSMAQKHWKKRVFLALGGRAMLEGAALVHCTALGEEAQSKRWFPRGKPVIIPYGVDMEAYASLPGAGPAREAFSCLADSSVPTVLFLSRLHYKKGPDVLIDACGELKVRGVAFRLVLAGDGDVPYVAELKERVARLGIGGHTHFVGQVSGPLKFSLYQACDVFALPTSQENFGLVYTEALACGTPVVTTKGTDIWSELQETGGVVIVDRTGKAFADALANLFADRARLKAMGADATPRVLRMFDQQTALQRFVDMYAAAAAARRH